VDEFHEIIRIFLEEKNTVMDYDYEVQVDHESA
jgi:hypothetical protein